MWATDIAGKTPGFYWRHKKELVWLRAGPEEKEKQAQSPTQQQRKQKDKAAASQLGLETCPYTLV